MRAALAVLALGTLLAAGCRGGGAPSPADPSAGGRGAALASVTVHNLTAHDLTIAFRPALGPGGEVVVGEVPAGGSRTVAPLPAEEPIRLYARAPGLRLELPPRTFENDEAWVWHIPADARFETVPERGP